MNTNGIVILNMVLSVVAIILFGMGYIERKQVIKKYQNNKDKDYFKAVLDSGKFNYMIVNVILGRFVPLMIFLEVIFSYVYGVDKINPESIIIKIVVAIIAGILYSMFQWNFMNDLYNKNKEAFTKMTFLSKYLFFNGVIAWGVIIATAVCYYPHEAIMPAIVQYVAWLFAGLFFGYVDWTKNRLSYANYIKQNKRKAKLSR